MVALVVLTIALGPALFLTVSAINTSTTIKNNLIAANLAQEGAEVIRAMRDRNWFLGSAFDSGIDNGTYRVQWDSDSLISLGSNPPIKLDNGVYNYSFGSDTVFRRTVTIQKLNSYQIRINSVVTWTERGDRQKSAQVESHLFDWK